VHNNLRQGPVATLLFHAVLFVPTFEDTSSLIHLNAQKTASRKVPGSRIAQWSLFAQDDFVRFKPTVAWFEGEPTWSVIVPVVVVAELSVWFRVTTVSPCAPLRLHPLSSLEPVAFSAVPPLRDIVPVMACADRSPEFAAEDLPDTG